VGMFCTMCQLQVHEAATHSVKTHKLY
jgi:hypothetical protein